jgi:hypothetical protein
MLVSVPAHTVVSSHIRQCLGSRRRPFLVRRCCHPLKSACRRGRLWRPEERPQDDLARTGAPLGRVSTCLRPWVSAACRFSATPQPLWRRAEDEAGATHHHRRGPSAAGAASRSGHATTSHPPDAINRPAGTFRGTPLCDERAVHGPCSAAPRRNHHRLVHHRRP